ncbi:xanthine dehydrogenase family protein molybdopterin-binding subunit [Pseudonocardia acaciae]|uniref:xanthine dehydrogenase family protein molybdopterin-binding subunit n=1 Tax=Pseudonocardia acaciae TaxID=551276 RepID=UPI00048D3A92|nr:xanthine dehydrogenase family protein molybdopterin-binding subunit [Pseudonocardia acaciae]
MTDSTLPTTGAPATPAPMRVVGLPLAHHDFVDKVKGTQLYAADWKLPGMLYGRVVRSVVPSARIRSVDTAEARALPGVIAVLTAADVPSNRIIERASGGLGELAVEMPVLAGDRVRFTGEPVALVAAVSQQIADEAAELVEVDYEELPGVFDPESALATDAPRVHDEGNVLVEWNIRRGDAEQALAEADLVVTGEYRSQHAEHAYLEPEAGVAWLDNGVLTIRVSTQVIEHAATISGILELPANKVRVISSYMGGGFGGKEDMTVEPYLALLVWHTKRPVRMIWDRQESMLASTKRHPFVMRYRTGVRSDGTIVAQDVDIVGDAGAYPYLSARVLFAGAALSCGPYRTPNASLRSRAVFTNNVPTSAFRGFGAMQVVLGYESQMDRVAAALGLPPAEVRRRNFLAKGDTIPTGESLDTAVASEETLRRALDRLGDPPAPSGPTKRVGRGFACNMQPYGRTIWFRDRASAWLSLQADGTLLIRSGITDLGAGQAASLCQIASEVLGVPLEEISVYIGDTALTPPAGGTYATRQLYMSGNAVLHAARQLRERLAPVAAAMLGCPADELSFTDGLVRGGPAGTGLRLAELVAGCERREVDTSVLAVWRAEQGAFDPVRGQGDSFPDYTYGTHATDVEVDIETGEVTVLRYVASHDVGRCINPMRVAGQIQGGAMQGLGYALMEDVVFEEGNAASTLFAHYFIPTAMDMPDVEVEIVESGEGKGPLNARGIGEPPIANTAAAVANAITAALGRRPTQLPMTPERVLELCPD